MTSTNVNVGFDGTGRMNSRILKPPGGGHTDIFSSSEPEKPRPRQHQLSSIVLGTDDDVPEKPKQTNGAAAEQPDGNGHAETTGAGDGAKEEVPVEQQPAKAEPPRRVRVPPGGFSSGLW